MHCLPASLRAPLTLAALALATLTAACGGSGSSSSSGSSSGGSSSGIFCKNPPSKGPLSDACASCGASACPTEQASVASTCASLVTCLEACQCGTGDCWAGCISAASSKCQDLINTFGDCEKMAPACSAKCTE